VAALFGENMSNREGQIWHENYMDGNQSVSLVLRSEVSMRHGQENTLHEVLILDIELSHDPSSSSIVPGRIISWYEGRDLSAWEQMPYLKRVL
jgi:hypothetical protein